MTVNINKGRKGSNIFHKLLPLIMLQNFYWEKQF